MAHPANHLQTTADFIPKALTGFTTGFPTTKEALKLWGRRTLYPSDVEEIWNSVTEGRESISEDRDLQKLAKAIQAKLVPLDDVERNPAWEDPAVIAALKKFPLRGSNSNEWSSLIFTDALNKFRKVDRTMGYAAQRPLTAQELKDFLMDYMRGNPRFTEADADALVKAVDVTKDGILTGAETNHLGEILYNMESQKKKTLLEWVINNPRKAGLYAAAGAAGVGLALAGTGLAAYKGYQWYRNDQEIRKFEQALTYPVQIVHVTAENFEEELKKRTRRVVKPKPDSNINLATYVAAVHQQANDLLGVFKRLSLIKADEKSLPDAREMAALANTVDLVTSPLLAPFKIFLAHYKVGDKPLAKFADSWGFRRFNKFVSTEYIDSDASTDAESVETADPVIELQAAEAEQSSSSPNTVTLKKPVKIESSGAAEAEKKAKVSGTAIAAIVAAAVLLVAGGAALLYFKLK